MDNFEVTCHGPSDTIKFYIREGYREPATRAENPISLLPEDPKTPVRDYPRKIDYIHGFVDGFSYSSADRLLKQRQMGVQRSYGNETIYRLPVTNTMMYGWPLVWKEKDILGDTDWYKTRVRYIVPAAEISRYQSDILRVNPTSFLFCTFY